MQLQLATPLITRDGTTVKDAKLYNCFWELDSQGQKIVVQRSAMSNDSKKPAGQGQGMFSNQGVDLMVQNDTMYGVGSWAGIAPTALPGVSVANLRMTVLNSNQLSGGSTLSIIKSTRDAWIVPNSGTATKIVGLYPGVTVPGMVYLDGTYYVMTQSGEIYGSALEDPATWTALNFISTDRGLGRAVALARHLNYVVAFCEKGVQFFYDAGNPGPGSPLLPVGNAATSVGCAHADSIQEMNDTMIFMGVDFSGGRSIQSIRGLTVSPFSDPNVDRVLQKNAVTTSDTQVYSMMCKYDGHTFYILTMGGTTLACDVDTQSWSEWGTYGGIPAVDGPFDPGFVLRPRTGVATYLLARTSGQTYSLAPGGIETVHMLIRTRTLDAGTTARKSLSELALLGDTVANTIDVRYSDNDGASWSNYRSINLRLPRKRLTRLGSFFRRMFEFNYFCSGDLPRLRLESMVLPDRNLPAQTQPDGE